MNKDYVEVIARVCHEVNRAYCASYGDHTQPTWEDAPESSRRATREGVEACLSGECTGPGKTHDNWAAALFRDGWVHGFEKDPVAKTHPGLVPFEHLPHREQVKDHLFIAVVRSLASYGFFTSRLDGI
jgi:hypothetical protein